MSTRTARPRTARAPRPSNHEATRAVLRVESVNPRKVVVFSASWMAGAWPTHRPQHLVHQTTPFEADVPAHRFHGVFQQVGGEGRMRVRLIGYQEGERGATAWSIGQDARVVSICVRDGEHAAMSM